jgi:hypothetical protein
LKPIPTTYDKSLPKISEQSKNRTRKERKEPIKEHDRWKDRQNYFLWYYTVGRIKKEKDVE